MKVRSSPRRALVRVCSRMVLLVATAVGLAAPRALADEALPAAASDSSTSFRWSALYRSRIVIARESSSLSWNDSASLSHVNDRLAILASYRGGDRWDAFVKGATGWRLEGEYRDARFALSEGHLGARLFGGALEGKLFSREMIFRTDNRLLEVLSNDAPFIDGRGEGCLFRLSAGSFRATYLESFLRNVRDIAASSGLPLVRGGADTYRLLSFDFRREGRAHAGGMLSQTLTTAGEDAVMIGSGAGLRLFGLELFAELARSSPGRWDDLARRSLFDLRPDEATFDRPSALFSPHNAFAAEADFIAPRSGSLGWLGLSGGYRFCGADFPNPEGELGERFAETFITAWWKHPVYDAGVSVEAEDGDRARGGEYRRLIASCRTRFRGGFELREGLLCSSGARTSAMLSLIDENRLSRMLLTARFDELGGDNVLSFYAEGGMNVGRSVTVKGALSVFRAAESLYSVELEFRPRDRFLLRAAFGSFSPTYEDITLSRRFDAAPPLGERMVTLLARVWFGSI